MRQKSSVDEFGYNSAESEQIWAKCGVKSGVL